MIEPTLLNLRYPVSAIALNPATRTARVMRVSKVQNIPPGSGNKKHIRSLSRSSLNKLAWTVINTSSKFTSILTLTYLCPPTIRAAKNHLNRFLQLLHRKLKQDLRYIWFLEFQRSGKVHYHILLNIPYNKQLHTFI